MNPDAEKTAEEVLSAFELTTIPIDPLFIAEQEGIALLPGDYRDAFDARIEYRQVGNNRRFCIFYSTEAYPWRPKSRVRFSIGHELGHFYIPIHRKYLLSGVWHGSQSSFISDKRYEREADEFAACLLMPRWQFQAEVESRSDGICTLRDLMLLARKTFMTSLTSTAIRYCGLDHEPCCVVLSHKGVVTYCVPSESFSMLELGWIESGAKVAAKSVTGKLTLGGAREDPDRVVEGETDSSVWLDQGRRSFRLWEEAALLGQQYVLTFLSAEQADEEDEECDEDEEA